MAPSVQPVGPLDPEPALLLELSPGSVESVIGSVVVDGPAVGSVAVGCVAEVVLADVVLAVDAVVGVPVGAVALPLDPVELSASVSATSVPA